MELTIIDNLMTKIFKKMMLNKILIKNRFKQTMIIKNKINFLINVLIVFKNFRLLNSLFNLKFSRYNNLLIKFTDIIQNLFVFYLFTF
jgi:hypothetical protein